MIRGIERRNIFSDDNDRDDFLTRLSVLLPVTGNKCYAWTFMDNHAHFLIQSGNLGIAVLMRRLLTGYVVSFNRRHQRHGQLFQNRYKSIICQEELATLGYNFAKVLKKVGRSSERQHAVYCVFGL